MREIVHIQAGQCGNQIGTKVRSFLITLCVFLKLYILHVQKRFILTLMDGYIFWGKVPEADYNAVMPVL